MYPYRSSLRRRPSIGSRLCFVYGLRLGFPLNHATTDRKVQTETQFDEQQTGTETDKSNKTCNGLAEARLHERQIIYQLMWR